MKISENVSLKNYSTMRLGGEAKALCEVKSVDDLKIALAFAREKNWLVVVIGEGSNIIWRDEGFSGLVIVNKIKGFEKISENSVNNVYKIGAGENWDKVVEKTVQAGLSGIECLSLIPGLAGATPIQNVGAYGQEIAHVLTELEVLELKSGKLFRISNNECGFGYRQSRFKSVDKGKFVVLSIYLKLAKQHLNGPFYPALQSYLDINNIKDYSPFNIRQAVIAIRKQKLPDWHNIATNGSFFENPIVSTKKYNLLKNGNPDIAGWVYQDGYKISGGWLLEKAGLKGWHDQKTGMATSDVSALVVINEKAKTTEDLLNFANEIITKIKNQFGVKLEIEPEII